MAYQLEHLKLQDLRAYDRNARTHSPEQVAQLVNSIREFGFTNPVLVDEVNTLIAGHGRSEAARLLGMETVPAIRLVGLTDQQKKALRIADNQLALNAGWDLELLAMELQELQDEDFDLDLLGFDDDFLAGLLDDDEQEGDEGEQEGELPEPAQDPISKPGDVWVLGNHRLMCGDSTIKSNVDTLLAMESWDVCVFDPPYEIESLYADAMPTAEPGKKLLVMWDFKRFALAPHSALVAGWEPQYEFIWDCVQSWYTPNRPLQRHKAIGVFGDDPFFDTDKSLIHDGKDRGQKRTVRNTRGASEYTPLDGAKHISTVEAFPNTAQRDEHGHGKPVQWIEAIFNGVGGTVYLDLFGGSGSTLIACEKTNRHARLMELDPKYCDLIIKRWQNLTGKHAIHAETGKKFSDLEREVVAVE